MAPGPNIFKRAWIKTGLNVQTLKLMFKGALPPTLALACYQATDFANVYTTLGYIICLMSLLSMPILPRAKFMQAMTLSVVFVCAAAGYALLEIQCAVKAREHTTYHPGPDDIGSSGTTESTEYNAAASTVTGIFLIVAVFIATMTRAFRPSLLIQTMQSSIFIVVCSVNSPTFATMKAGEVFVRRLLITFLTGFAFASGVSLFVFPVTSRKIARMQMAGMVGLMKNTLRTHQSYMDAVLDRDEMGYPDMEKCAAEASKLRNLGNGIGESFGKVKIEVAFARKEFAFGYLRPEDLTKLTDMLRCILLPMAGISTFLGIVQSAGEKREADDEEDDINDVQELMMAIRRLDANDWREIFEMSAGPYAELQKVLVDGLDHILYQLKFAPKPKQTSADDVEKEAEATPGPGDANFASYLRDELDRYHEHRETVIQRWSEQKGVNLPATFWDDQASMEDLRRVATQHIKSKGTQQQLYLQLFAEFIIYSTGNAILRMVEYADSKVEDGTMSHRKFINPGLRRIRKLFALAFFRVDGDSIITDEGHNGTHIWVGDSLKAKRDPEHMPPETRYQRFTNHVRMFPRIFASPQAAFALRAALASISIGIICFIRQTQPFFQEQRGMWSLIMVSICMGAHSGQGIFGFLYRVMGTVVAVVATIVIWYVGYKRPEAIIPLMGVYLLCGWWFLMKHPQWAMVGLISMITGCMVIGYQLQAVKIGIKASEANGQAYYPIYLLAPMRLLAVVIGLSTAFFWTYFPYPITTHATLRRDTGQTLFLLANYYACIHATIDLRLHGIPEGSEDDSTNPVSKLAKARFHLLSKCVLMLGRLREHSNFTRFEPTFGGKFPIEKYDALILSMQQIFRYLSLIGYAANAFASAPDREESQWIKDFRQFASDINLTTNEFTSTLCLVSASIQDAQPLPPFLKTPKPYALDDKLSDLDPDILSTKHVNEPSYAAFAVLAVTSTLLSEEMGNVIRLIRDLVGEVDFTFHMQEMKSDSSSEVSVGTSTTGKRLSMASADIGRRLSMASAILRRTSRASARTPNLSNKSEESLDSSSSSSSSDSSSCYTGYEMSMASISTVGADQIGKDF